MSRISEHDSDDNKSSQDTEHLSESGTESETGEYTLSSLDQKGDILDIQFPMPFNYPKPYLTLREVIDNILDHTWNRNITEDPDEALHYIINHFNSDVVAELIRQFPHYTFEQVYYSTYIETHRFTRLQYLISLASKNLWYNALAQQWLAIEQHVRYYSTSDTLSPYLLQCLL